MQEPKQQCVCTWLGAEKDRDLEAASPRKQQRQRKDGAGRKAGHKYML